MNITVFEKLIVFLTVVILLISLHVKAEELDLNYSEYTFRELNIGKRNELTPPIEVFNSSDRRATYNITPTRLEANNGYYPLPSLNWIKIADSILVEANSNEKIEIGLDIPDSSLYFNRRFLFGIEIKRGFVDRDDLKISGIIKLKGETKAKKMKSGEQIYPSTININTRKNRKFSFWVKNSNKQRNTYKLFFNSNLDKNIQRTIGYNRFFKENLIKLKTRRVDLAPGTKEKITGKIKIGQMEAQKRFEKILWVEDAQENKEFIRLLIENQ